MPRTPSAEHALTQAERNRRSMEKLGKVRKLFIFEPATAALLQQLATAQDCSATEAVRRALKAHAQQLGLPEPPPQ